jgi:hypothetical protein
MRLHAAYTSTHPVKTGQPQALTSRENVCLVRLPQKYSIFSSILSHSSLPYPSIKPKTIHMKKILLGVLPWLFVACGGDPVQKDLLNYINVEMPKLADLESEAVEAYASVSGQNYTNDSIMYAVMSNTVVPKYQEFYGILESIQPATDDVQDLHKEYVRAASDQLQAFQLILEAIEKQDVTIIETANGDLDEARTLLKLWREDLDAACAKHNVIINGEGEEGSEE